MKLLLIIFLILPLLKPMVVNDDYTEEQSLNRFASDATLMEQAAMQQASVRRRRKDAYRFGVGHICGGSLISPNVVLTAAHCFIDQSKFDGTFLSKSDFLVVLGTKNRFQKTEDTEIFDVKELFMQMPKFNLNTYSKDIALIVLKGSICHSDLNVRPIPLAAASFPSNTSCQLNGWGTPEKIFYVDILLVMTVSLFSKPDCRQQTNISQSGLRCAGFLDEMPPDVCTTDTGGPIMCTGHLVGIVSWSIKCGKSHVPAVYTDVSHYSEWIERIIGKFPPDQCPGYPPETPRISDPRNIQLKNSNAAFSAPFRPSVEHVFLISLQSLLIW